MLIPEYTNQFKKDIKLVKKKKLESGESEGNHSKTM